MFTALRWLFFVPFSLVNSHCWFAGKTRNTNERCYGDIMPLWQGWQELRMTFMHSCIHDKMHIGSSQLVPYRVETCWHSLSCSFANGFSSLFRSGLFTPFSVPYSLTAMHGLPSGLLTRQGIHILPFLKTWFYL